MDANTSAQATMTTVESLDYCDTVDRDFLVERFWLCVVVGLTVSLISVVENIFIFALFITNRQHRNSYNLYLMLLAFFDVFMGMSYIALMSVNVLVNYTSSYLLKHMWASYMVPMLTISHIAMTTSSYLITFAAIERYAITVGSRSVEALQMNRRFFVMTAFAIALITKATMFFEVAVNRNEECAGHVQEFAAFPGPLTGVAWFNKYFRFYFRTISTIFTPFFILLYLNFRLVFRLTQPSREKNGQILDVQNAKQKKARIRAATRTLIILVFTYIISNLMNVIISFWEYVDVETLFTDYVSFYIISVDAVSLLTIVSCALRLPIYMSCQPLLRKEAKQFLINICSCCCGKGGISLLRNGSAVLDKETNSQTLIASPPELQPLTHPASLSSNGSAKPECV